MTKSTNRPIAFVMAATNHGTMLVNRHDYRIVNNQGYGVGYQLLNSSAFDQSEVDFVLQLLQARKNNFGSGVVAIDCGANIGVHTIEWAKLMHGWGEVIAFEAQERIFYALAGNLTINNCFNARAIWAAVGSSSGEISVPVPDYFSPSSFGSLEIRQSDQSEYIGQHIDRAKNQPTKLMSIDELSLQRLDLIKIDIEGMEVEALNGARATIQRTRPQMIIEKIKSNEGEITSILKEYGYQWFPFGLNILAVHEGDPVLAQISIRK